MFHCDDTSVSYELVSDCTKGIHQTMRNIQTEQHSDSHRARAGFGHFLQRGAAFCLPIPSGTGDLLYFVHRQVKMTSKQRLQSIGDGKGISIRDWEMHLVSDKTRQHKARARLANTENNNLSRKGVGSKS